MKNYVNFDGYLEELSHDVYAQPADSGHAKWAVSALTWAMNSVSIESKNVLDCGCGQINIRQFFVDQGMSYVGVTLGDDADLAVCLGENWVVKQDFSFLDFADSSFDIVYSRHSLEHSPFPLLTLMEWHRVAKNYLFLILPNPQYWGWTGKNHYSLLNDNQIQFYFERSGWEIVCLDIESVKEELRYVCKKVDRR